MLSLLKIICKKYNLYSYISINFSKMQTLIEKSGKKCNRLTKKISRRIIEKEEEEYERKV